MKLLETAVEKTQFKVEVSAMDISSSDETITKVSDYQLTCYKIMMKNVPSQSDNNACLGCYALNLAEWLQNSEIGTFGMHLKAGGVKDG